MSKLALVTGSTGGIGLGIAKESVCREVYEKVVSVCTCIATGVGEEGL